MVAKSMGVPGVIHTGHSLPSASGGVVTLTIINWNFLCAGYSSSDKEPSSVLSHSVEPSGLSHFTEFIKLALFIVELEEGIAGSLILMTSTYVDHSMVDLANQELVLEGNVEYLINWELLEGRCSDFVHE